MLNKKVKFRAIVLAGGKGLRLGEITKKTPKPLIKVLNKEFLYYLIKFLKINNVDEIIITTNYKNNLFKKYFRKSSFKNIKIVNENKVLGTGGSFLNVINGLKFKQNTINFVCNADTLLLFSLNKLKHLLVKNKYTILSVKKNNCKRYGKLMLKKNNVLSIEKNQSAKGYISSGYFFFKKFDKNIINKRSEKFDFENDIIETMLKKRINIKCINLNLPFIDIGVIKELKKSEVFIKKYYNEFIKKL